MRVYRLLLRLLPRARRETYGDEMAAVFMELQAAERRESGALAAAWLWIREVLGVLKMSIVNRSGRGTALTPALSPPNRTGGAELPTELRWAWRGVLARGWRAGFVIGVLAVALAANAAVFAVADSLIFERYPYPHPERIVQLAETLPEGTRRSSQQMVQRDEAWAREADIFTAVGVYYEKNVFVTGSGVAEQVRTVDVSIGFMDVLGVPPQWGRPFAPGDDVFGAEFAVLLSEGLARRYFGSPQAALGQALDTTVGPHRVVGVMPAEFAFPAASFEMWRAIDAAGPMTQRFGLMRAIARVVPGLDDETLARLLDQRAPAVGAALGLPSYTVTAERLLPDTDISTRETRLLILLGAALCLLLAACASVASLELANAIGRARRHAILLALGATRSSLARIAAAEGALLIGAAVALGLGLTWLAQDVLLASLPDALTSRSQNRIGLDERAVFYTVGVAVLAWLFAALPPVVAASRSSLLSLLKLDDRTAVASRTAVRLRQALTVSEVAVAVVLVIGGLLYTRSYLNLLAVEKGFDSSRLAQIRVILPNGHFATRAARDTAVTDLMRALESRPEIEAVTQAAPPPGLGDSPAKYALEFDDRPPLAEPVYIGANWVDAAYFDVIQLPVRAGRVLRAGDSPEDAVVNETFARKFWQGGDAVGRSFRVSPRHPWQRIVGVVGDFRSDRLKMPSVDDDRVFYYLLWQPPPAPRPLPPGVTAPPAVQVDTGGSYGFISLIARLASPSQASVALDVARSFDPGLTVSVEMVDDAYASQNADTNLVSQVVGGFSVLAFLVAMAGIYGLMTFLVSGRRREIGVRMALGADAADIRRLILSSSMRLVVIGAGIGTLGALGASRWIESEMFGLTSTDPATYTAVAVVVIVTAMLATWQPARQAARVDPAVTLRAE